MIDLDEAQHLIKLFLNYHNKINLAFFIQPCDSLINDHPDVK